MSQDIGQPLTQKQQRIKKKIDKNTKVCYTRLNFKGETIMMYGKGKKKKNK